MGLQDPPLLPPVIGSDRKHRVPLDASVDTGHRGLLMKRWVGRRWENGRDATGRKEVRGWIWGEHVLGLAWC